MVQLNTILSRLRRTTLGSVQENQPESNGITGGAMGKPVTLEQNSNEEEWFRTANECLFSGMEQEAIKYFQMAAFQGHADALGVLGFCYEFGLGIEQNFKEAESLYLQAAIKDCGLGIFVDAAAARMSFLRKYGRPSIKIDRVEAEEWADKVNLMGPDAIQWLANAAEEKRLTCAMYAYGVCYHDGYLN
jgi:TPR repeat protein